MLHSSQQASVKKFYHLYIASIAPHPHPLHSFGKPEIQRKMLINVFYSLVRSMKFIYIGGHGAKNLTAVACDLLVIYFIPKAYYSEA